MSDFDVRDGLLGLAVGDALGVPVEFHNRRYLSVNPVRDMRDHGVHNQPAGTWSDDSSLAFCLAESLCQGWDLEDQAEKFCQWIFESYWTPHGKVFDVGGTTSKALFELRGGTEPVEAGGGHERDNGNGSLMRILPLAYYLHAHSVEDIFPYAHRASCLTHGHPRSQMACGIYIDLALRLLEGKELSRAYKETCEVCSQYYAKEPFQSEKKVFSRLLRGEIPHLKISDIQSSGYVLHTLEASLWCLFQESKYRDTALTAVNLGGDTDTTGAVAGGLAGILYGWESIPDEWIEVLARKEDIFDLARRLQKALENGKEELK